MTRRSRRKQLCPLDAVLYYSCPILPVDCHVWDQPKPFIYGPLSQSQHHLVRGCDSFPPLTTACSRTHLQACGRLRTWSQAAGPETALQLSVSSPCSEEAHYHQGTSLQNTDQGPLFSVVSVVQENLMDSQIAKRQTWKLEKSTKTWILDSSKESATPWLNCKGNPVWAAAVIQAIYGAVWSNPWLASYWLFHRELNLLRESENVTLELARISRKTQCWCPCPATSWHNLQ